MTDASAVLIDQKTDKRDLKSSKSSDRVGNNL